MAATASVRVTIMASFDDGEPHDIGTGELPLLAQAGTDADTITLAAIAPHLHLARILDEAAAAIRADDDRERDPDGP